MNIENHPLLKKHPHKVPNSIRSGSPPMMAIIATLTAKPGRAEDLREALALAASLVRLNEPGVPEYHATQSKEDPHIFKMFEVYRDQTALQTHTHGTAYIGELLPLLRDAMAKEPEVEWLDAILY